MAEIACKAGVVDTGWAGGSNHFFGYWVDIGGAPYSVRCARPADPHSVASITGCRGAGQE